MSRLAARGARLRAAAAGVSVALHALAVLLPARLPAPSASPAESPQSQGMATRFIERRPRMVTPFEAAPAPAPQPRVLARAMEQVTIRARVGWGTVSLTWPVTKFPDGFREAAVGGLAPEGLPEPLEPFVISSPLGPITMYPYATWGSPPLWRARLDLLALDGLDFGRYHALVIRHPKDKRQIEGFCHLTRVVVPSIVRADGTGRSDQSRALARLARAVAEHTGMACDLSERGCALDDPEVLKVPLVYVTAYNAFALQPNERNALGRYLVSGGLVFAEDARQGTERGPATQSIRRMLEDALGVRGYRRGRAWAFKRLPPSHPLYHTFFDFDGPPAGEDAVQGRQVVDYLEGVTLGDRLVAVVSRKGIGRAWDAPEARGLGPARALQFGVNLVVFTLTQPGSITDRAMGTVIGVE